MYYNITPFIRWPGAGLIVVACSVIPNVMLPAGWGILVGIAFGVTLCLAFMMLVEGDRFWLASTRSGTLPYELIVKPRGYRGSTNISNSSIDGSDEKVQCDGCDNDFHPAEDHFESDYTEYCPDCSKVGEAVMKNYQQWFDTAEDIRHGE